MCAAYWEHRAKENVPRENVFILLELRGHTCFVGGFSHYKSYNTYIMYTLLTQDIFSGNIKTKECTPGKYLSHLYPVKQNSLKVSRHNSLQFVGPCKHAYNSLTTGFLKIPPISREACYWKQLLLRLLRELFFSLLFFSAIL